MRRVAILFMLTALVLGGLAGVTPPPAAAAGDWIWPVVGPVTRGYDPPLSVYGAGHRGIDIAVAFGTEIHAPATGTVSFAGKVGVNLFLTIAHDGGLSSTYSWVSALLVHEGDAVTVDQPVALTGSGHPGDLLPSLHFGVKLDGAYVNPLLYLDAFDVGALIRLAPV
jgi:murein DD-endopeptidase MepM/ murein hydrolase activator NlpD